MEDFTGAYIERKRDVLALLGLKANHGIAIFHLGGVAIECRLKAIMILYHQINRWDDISHRQGDAMYGQIIKNPSHGLLTALRRIPKLYKHAKLDKAFLKHLSHIHYPLGATSIDYISLRYIPQTSKSQNDWQQSFDYVCKWLKKNETNVL